MVCRLLLEVSGGSISVYVWIGIEETLRVNRTVTVVFVKPSNCARSYIVDMEGAVSPGGSPRKLEARRRDMGLSFFEMSLRVVAWLDAPEGSKSADVEFAILMWTAVFAV